MTCSNIRHLPTREREIYKIQLDQELINIRIPLAIYVTVYLSRDDEVHDIFVRNRDV